MKEPKFLELTNDTVFKTLWYRGDKNVRKYLERMVEYALGHPIGEYNFGPNEQGILSYEQIANKVDVQLISKDKTYKINVEMNRLDRERSGKKRIQSSENKSDVYLANFVANFYNDLEDKYETAINVEQVEFEAFYCPENKLISKLDFEFVDLNYLIVKNNIKSHLLYLSRLRDLCYNQEEEIYKDFAMLVSKSYEEMDELAKGNKEREAVVAFVKRLGADKMFIDESLQREYERIDAKIAREEAVEEATEEGLKRGIEQGIEQGILKGKEENTIEMIQRMYSKKMSLEDIASITELDILKIKEILNIKE